MNEQPQTHEQIITNALQSRPLAPLPDNFVQQVMAEVQALSPEPIQVRFRLDFMDWAIPFFLAVLALIIVGLIRQWPLLYGMLGGEAEPITAVFPAFNPIWLFIIGLIVTAEIFLAGAVGVWLWIDQPLPTARHS